MWETWNDLLSFGDGNTAGNLEARPGVVVGYGVKIFLPSPPNYVTRSPGCNVGAMLYQLSYETTHVEQASQLGPSA